MVGTLTAIGPTLNVKMNLVTMSAGTSRSSSPSLVQLGLDVYLLGHCVGEMPRAGCAVELPLPGQVIIDFESCFFSFLFLDRQLVLDLIDVFPSAKRNDVE